MSEPIDAEITGTALVRRENQAVGQAMSIAELEQQFSHAVRQRELISAYIKSQLIPDQHYYKTRDGAKATLTKEGAEIICLPHGLVPDYVVTAGPNEPPDGDQPYQITVKCILRKNGFPQSFCGSGIGSAGSHKGAWDNKNWEYRPRQNDRFLCHNATLKMAQKSAYIAATLNSTAASEFFTQDLEPEAGEATPAKSSAARSATPAPAAKPAATQKPSADTQVPIQKPLSDQWKTYFIGEMRLKGLAHVALAWCYQQKIIEKGQRMEEGDPKLFPASKAAFDEVVAHCKTVLAEMDGDTNEQMIAAYDHVYGGQPDSAPTETKPKAQETAKEYPQGTMMLEGVKIGKVNTKTGENKQGPWTVYSFKIGEVWYSTFSDTLGNKAQQASKLGTKVTLYFTETDRGASLVDIV